MTKLFRLLIAGILLGPALATAQSATTAAPSQQVSQLAPQLLAFAGNRANFDSLVNGLALGSPVTLVTVLPGGQVQTVTFAPQSTMGVTQIAQTLELARQSLISRGIATPTGQQLAVALAGGVLPTQTGSVQVGAILPAANLPATTAAAGASATGTSSVVTTTTAPVPNPNGPPSPAAILQGQSGAGGTTPPSPAQIIQNNRGPNISDTPTPGNISNTPTTAAPATGTAGGTPAAPATSPSGSAPSGR